MAFSNSVYTQIQSESNRLGVSTSYYINTMIRQSDPEKIQTYYEQQPVKASKDCIPRKKGNKLQRITVKIEPDVYRMISAGAEEYNQTLTQYVNLVLGEIFK